MKTVRVTITGRTDLLLHADNIEWSDKMEEWKKDPNNKSRSKAGDDRTPPYRWIGCLNYDEFATGIVAVPSQNIMRAIMEGAAQVPTGRGPKTFKSQSQSGLLCKDVCWPLIVSGHTIQMADILSLMPLSFSEQMKAVEHLGFSLMVKRARVGAAKHVRVRPWFKHWSISGEIVIMDELITTDILRSILDIAGTYKGLGDWRPSGKTPGPFGTFESNVVEIRPKLQSANERKAQPVETAGKSANI
jgi:hypothetical protein